MIRRLWMSGRLVPALLAACALTSCASKMQRIYPARGPGAGDGGVESSRGGLISVRTTGCLGSCPVYSIDIDRDGLVTYEGKSGVCAIGKQTKRLPPAVIASIESKTQEYGLDKIDERCCTCPMADVPSTIITTHLQNATKTIVHTAYCPAPRSVIDFEGYINGAVGVEDWIGTVLQRQKCSNSF